LLPVAVVISGRGSNMEAIARAAQLGDSRYRVVRVIADRPEAGGLARAATLGVPTAVVPVKSFTDRAAFEEALHAEIAASGAELVALAGFMRILSPRFVARLEGRLLNIHPSLLPKLRGIHTHERALAAGETEHGASIHFVTPELDGGPAFLQASVPVLPGDDAERLAERVLAQEHRLYPLALRWFAEGRVRLDGDTVRLDGRPLAQPARLAELEPDAAR